MSTLIVIMLKHSFSCLEDKDHHGFFPLWLKRHSLGGMGHSWVKTVKSLGPLMYILDCLKGKELASF